MPPPRVPSKSFPTDSSRFSSPSTISSSRERGDLKEIMTPWDFGLELLRLNDLDPVYVILYEANLELPLFYRWLLSYLCFYHVGTASWIVSQPDYWRAMEVAGGSKEYPRAHERRHFRGENARKSIAWLKSKGIEALIPALLVDRSKLKTMGEVISRVLEWEGFGPWAAFKAADMLERLGMVSLTPDDSDLSFYTSPREGAQKMWRDYGGVGTKEPEEGVIPWAVDTLLRCLREPYSPVNSSRKPSPQFESLKGSSASSLVSSAAELTRKSGKGVGNLEDLFPRRNGKGEILAPPRYERVINIQECETILCKWHSYSKGHYILGEDVEATRKGLLLYGRCKVAHALYAGGRRGGLWR